MSSIKVAVRCRPLLEGERAATGLDIQNRRILLDSKAYDPDHTFPPSAQQEDLFQLCAPVLNAVQEGGINGTIMVYGQTGTGKTYTMLGKEGQHNGLVHMVIASMLEHTKSKADQGTECALTLSMIEIYNEKLRDMLSTNEDEEVALIAGFPRLSTKVALTTLEDAVAVVSQGLASRHTACTMMNDRSSRSHVVLIVDYESVNPFTGDTEVSHLFLVDLAGSESVKKSQAVGSTATEAGKINRSLLALKTVFLALSNTSEATRPSHIPYRDSKLTELLQDSIGGTARTLMIACISAVGRDLEETKSTLMYAVKAKSIRNATNSEREKLLIRLRSLEVENQKLRNRLDERVTERGSYTVTREEHLQQQQLEAEVEELREGVKQLVQQNQAASARQHIVETHAKALEKEVSEKEEELQQFKVLYHESMKKFELQARRLQCSVQAAVSTAQDTAHEVSLAQFNALQGWRRSLEDAADHPIVHRAKINTNHPISSSCGSASAALESGTRIVRADEDALRKEEEQYATAVAAVSRTSSPSKHSMGCLNRSPLHLSRSPSPHRTDEVHLLGVSSKKMTSSKSLYADSTSLPPSSLACPTSESKYPRTTADVLRESDEACELVLERIYGAFRQLISALLSEKNTFQQRLFHLQQERRSTLKALSEQLQRQVADSVRQMEQRESSTEREVERATGDWDSRWRVALGIGEGRPVTQDCTPEMLPVSEAALSSLGNASRNMCRAISDSVRHVFPSTADPPAPLIQALQAVSLVQEQEIDVTVADQLGPLSSLENGLGMRHSFGVGASEPTVVADASEKCSPVSTNSSSSAAVLPSLAIGSLQPPAKNSCVSATSATAACEGGGRRSSMAKVNDATQLITSRVSSATGSTAPGGPRGSRVSIRDSGRASRRSMTPPSRAEKGFRLQVLPVNSSPHTKLKRPRAPNLSNAEGEKDAPKNLRRRIARESASGCRMPTPIDSKDSSRLGESGKVGASTKKGK